MPLPPFSGEAGDHQFWCEKVGLVAKVLEERHVVSRIMVRTNGFLIKVFMVHCIIGDRDCQITRDDGFVFHW